MLGYFLLTRLLLLIIGYCCINEFSLHQLEKNPAWLFHHSTWLNMWGTWDSSWYMDIAEHWYPVIKNPVYDGDCGQCNFFPLYPGLMQSVHYLTGINYFIAGLIISNLSLLIAGICLFKIVMHLFNSIEKAQTTVLFLFLSPVSFILSGVFTESLYLALILLSTLAALKSKWWLAGICGFLLTLTRSIGIFIIIPLLLQYLKQKNYSVRNIRADILFLALIPAGAALFLLQNFISTGDALYFTHNPHWLYQSLNPFRNLYDGLMNSYFTFRFDAIYTIVVITVALLFCKRLPLSLNVINLYTIFIPLSFGIVSMPRMTLVAFPLFIQLAMAADKTNTRTMMMIALAMLQTYCAVCWFLGFGNVV